MLTRHWLNKCLIISREMRKEVSAPILPDTRVNNEPDYLDLIRRFSKKYGQVNTALNPDPARLQDQPVTPTKV